jgi:hypothetical protein
MGVPAVDDDRVTVDRDLAAEGPHHRVSTQQVRHGVDGAEVVGGHELEVGALLARRPEEVAADPTEPVDADTNGHAEILLSAGLTG